MTSRGKKRKAKRKRQPDPESLLAALATALQRCEKAGLRPKLRHGIVCTDAGYVLVIRDRWVARLLRKAR